MKTEKFADEWIAMYGVHAGVPREGSDEEDKDSLPGERDGGIVFIPHQATPNQQKHSRKDKTDRDLWKGMPDPKKSRR